MGASGPFAPAFGKAQVHGFPVPHHLGFVFEAKHEPLELLFLDAFEYVIRLAWFHDSAFVTYSTKSLQDQSRLI